MYFILGLVKSTLLYGLVSLVACAFAPQIATSTNEGGRIAAIYSFMYVSAAAYPLLLAIHPLLGLPGRRRLGVPFVYTQSLFDSLGADFTNPFRGLVALRGASKVIDSKGVSGAYAWAQVYLHLAWAVAFWIWFALVWVVLTS